VNRFGGEDILGTGHYLDIDRPRRLVFTFKIAQFSDTVDRVTVEIAPLEKGCRLTLLTQEITVPHEDAMAPHEIEVMLHAYASETEKGWNGMFDALAAMLT